MGLYKGTWGHPGGGGGADALEHNFEQQPDRMLLSMKVDIPETVDLLGLSR